MKKSFKKKQKNILREGFTTGSAATASIIAAINALYAKKVPSFVKIFAPAGELNIAVHKYIYSDYYAKASVIKDGGDDPDCTHNIEIFAEVYLNSKHIDNRSLNSLSISDVFDFFVGEGVGIVTKKGLPINIGEPAINPIPRKMIKENVEKLINLLEIREKPSIILSVPKGKEVAKKTLNNRLGIIGGISILGTTGIVRPISMSAFTSSIDIALNIAKEKGLDTVVLSFGRQSEESAMKLLDLPEEAFVMMGDHFDYTYNRAKKVGFKNIIISSQLGKLLKALLGYKNTNVKYGEFDIKEVINFFREIKIVKDEISFLTTAHTARHLLEIIENNKLFHILNRLTDKFCEKFKVGVLLFSYDGRLLARS